ncbi:hypothetical protein OVA03_11760 [Asticcacaulis sp. SL142]|jgi:hypothetical protein|uniref:hypothetical protein n=1 Tax=Asticcacaulis sp. SL142 TaxID=2995155 RepID=UPI00226D34D6|nr:hypothetical protein [Asticcacaulis sp. SL142]WAC47378.1 hypothetical protein OVA03_11760 [Asticcacaulis sp. SL142]
MAWFNNPKIEAASQPFRLMLLPLIGDAVASIFEQQWSFHLPFLYPLAALIGIIHGIWNLKNRKA